MGKKYDRELLEIRALRKEEGEFLWRMVMRNLTDQVRPILTKQIFFSPLAGLILAATTIILYYFSENFILSLCLPAIIMFSCARLYFFKEMREYELRFPEEKANLWEYYNRPGTAFWVATYDGKVIGTVAIDKKSDSTAELKRMIVENDYRRLGIAQMLVTNAIEFSKKHGYNELILETSGAQMPAVKLYQKCGFKIEQEIVEIDIPGLIKLKAYKLGMSL